MRDAAVFFKITPCKLLGFHMVNHSQTTKYFHEYNDMPAKRKYYKQYKYKRVNVNWQKQSMV